jgi:hypothetical protein
MKVFDLPPEGPRVSRLRLLLCAFWRKEIARLAYLQIGRAKPTARQLVGGFFIFGRILKVALKPNRIGKRS